jgi:hypothetical protein
MPDINPLAVIAECIEKAKATTDQELISDYIAEALGVLQIDNTEPHRVCRRLVFLSHAAIGSVSSSA